MSSFQQKSSVLQRNSNSRWEKKQPTEASQVSLDAEFSSFYKYVQRIKGNCLKKLNRSMISNQQTDSQEPESI